MNIVWAISPKIYFYDTGLLCCLFGIKTIKDYETSIEKRKDFENFIISETIKNYENNLIEPRLSFYRDTNGVEVDIIDETNQNNIKLCEIKASAIYRDKFRDNLDKVDSRLQIKGANIILYCSGNNNFSDKDISIKTLITLHNPLYPFTKNFLYRNFNNNYLKA